MNRRSFLGLLGGLGASSATSYFFAPIGGWIYPAPHWDNREYWRQMMRLSAMVSGTGFIHPDSECGKLAKQISDYENQPRLKLKLVSEDALYPPKPVHAYVPNNVGAMRYKYLDEAPEGWENRGGIWHESNEHRRARLYPATPLVNAG